MMEQPETSMTEDYVVFISSLDTLLIHHASRWCSQVGNAALAGSVYVIWEREERIARARDSGQSLQMLRPLLYRQRLGHGFE